jgi:hypothetical protein
LANGVTRSIFYSVASAFMSGYQRSALVFISEH